MSSMLSESFRTWFWASVKSGFICAFVAPFIGLACLGVFRGAPLAVTYIDIAGVPFYVYAIVGVGIPAFVLGAGGQVAGIVLMRFSAIRRLEALQALALGGMCGAVTGATFITLFAGLSRMDAPVVVCAMFSGLVCGSLIAWRSRSQFG